MPEISLCVDRFEGDQCICIDEKKQIRHLPSARLPKGAHEGSWLICRDGILLIDTQKTHETQARIARKMERLWE